VLKGIDTTISAGEVVCVIGPSGSGKSTFLRCLNKLEDITAGKVVVDEYDLTDRKVDLDKVRQHIGMVFQHFNLFPHMSVIQTSPWHRFSRRRWTRRRRRRRPWSYSIRSG
jgi:glutamine transport system ATP-binding protein